MPAIAHNNNAACRNCSQAGLCIGTMREVEGDKAFHMEERPRLLGLFLLHT